MSQEQKIEALRDSALKLDKDGKVDGSLQEDHAGLADDTDILWVCLAAFLVFFMQAGFAMVESGLTRAKNACNILMKNLMDFSIGSVAFWAIGFGLMFGLNAGGGESNGLIGWSAFFFDGQTVAGEAEKSTGFSWAFLIFQTVFAATAATIVSGAMAERTKFRTYLIYTVFLTVIVYPLFGHWAWGNLFFGNKTWLIEAGFIDFAGSTVVHSVGGWAGLAGALVIGARMGKYGKDGKVRPIPGHSMPLAALGVFILWLGWFGFNPGSTTAIGGGEFARVAVTTNLAAAAAAIVAMATSWIMFKKPDTSMAFNGALAGLVGITAGCYNMTPYGALLIGVVCGVAVVFSVLFFDKLRVDDPVGAISVHGVCGAIGTLAVGLWGVEYGETVKGLGLFNGGGTDQIIAQAKGVGAAFVLVMGLMLPLFLALKYTVGLRVDEKEEDDGLDIHEHGNEAYPAGVVGSGAAKPSTPTA